MDNYILMNDMVQDHEARMMHLKRYYPFFRLMDTGLSQYRDGSYGRLDMSYIVLAVLRFFIEANHFQDQPVCYEDYRQFMAGLLVRDFDFTEEEADDELYQYIFPFYQTILCSFRRLSRIGMGGYRFVSMQ